MIASGIYKMLPFRVKRIPQIENEWKFVKLIGSRTDISWIVDFIVFCAYLIAKLYSKSFALNALAVPFFPDQNAWNWYMCALL